MKYLIHDRNKAWEALPLSNNKLPSKTEKSQYLEQAIENATLEFLQVFGKLDCEQLSKVPASVSEDNA